MAAVTSTLLVLTAASLADPCDGPPGSGLVAVGGFAFAPHGTQSRHWSGFAPASLVVPEVSLARQAGRTRLTVNVDVAPDDTLDLLGNRVARCLERLREAPLPMLDPSPAGRVEVVSTMPPAHYEEAVARAVQRIESGELEKVVLAREVEVHAQLDHDPGAVVAVLRDAFPSCYVFAVGRGDATFVAGEKGGLLWNGGHWRGRFKLFLGPRGKLSLVTRLSLERYLLGVVPGEIGALRDSLLEAGRAQAIAARSYSLFYRGRRAAEGFDMYGTVEDQVYGPVEAERPLATRCVETTRGQASLTDQVRAV